MAFRFMYTWCQKNKMKLAYQQHTTFLCIPTIPGALKERSKDRLTASWYCNRNMSCIARIRSRPDIELTLVVFFRAFTSTSYFSLYSPSTSFKCAYNNHRKPFSPLTLRLTPRSMSSREGKAGWKLVPKIDYSQYRIGLLMIFHDNINKLLSQNQYPTIKVYQVSHLKCLDCSFPNMRFMWPLSWALLVRLHKLCSMLKAKTKKKKPRPHAF
jgi:hypothetical protein